MFAEPGDQYLGRCLAGLPAPNAVDFAVLPPHFIYGMENDDVKQALQICFGCIIDLYEERQSGGIIGVLLYFLASVVYHMDAFVKPVIEKQPNHPFSAIPLLQYPGLLQRLQKFVTLDRTDNMPQATGIPLHIDHSQKLSEILLKVTQITSMMMHQTEEIKASVVQAIEEHDIRGGVITIDLLNNRLKEHHKQLEQVLCDQLQQGGITNDQVTRPLPEQEHQQGQQKGIDHTLYYYDGKFWQVPRGWQFPEKILRRTGWSLWLNGQPGIVRPFRLLDPPSLSPDKKLRDRLKLEWRPIFQMMEQAPDMEIPTGSHNVTPEFVEQSFLQGTYISRQELDMFGSIQQDLKFLLSAHGLNMFSRVTLRSLGMIMTVPIFHLQIGTMLPTAINGSGGASLHLRYLIKEEEFVRDTILLEITSEYLYKYISYYVYTIQSKYLLHKRCSQRCSS